MGPHAPNDLEAQGLVWASGPFIVPGRVVGDGLTIFNVPEETDIHRLMQKEPLTKKGMRTYTAHRWELREGMMAIELYLRSRSSSSIDGVSAGACCQSPSLRLSSSALLLVDRNR